jgi:hypothetical protein
MPSPTATTPSGPSSTPACPAKSERKRVTPLSDQLASLRAWATDERCKVIEEVEDDS